MNNPVSGESSAKGLSVILPYIAVDPAAVAIRRPEFLKRLELGWAGLGRLGVAWQGWSKARILARRGFAGRGLAGHGMARLGKARNLGWRNNQQTQNTHGTR